MPFDVAMALGYVPNHEPPRWKIVWNRFRYWWCPSDPPRSPYDRPSSDVADPLPLSAEDQAEVTRQLEISDASWKKHNLVGGQVDQGHESPAFQVMRRFTKS